MALKKITLMFTNKKITVYFNVPTKEITMLVITYVKKMLLFVFIFYKCWLSKRPFKTFCSICVNQLVLNAERNIERCRQFLIQSCGG